MRRSLMSLALFACFALAQNPKDDQWMGFTAYPGARELCDQHVLGSGAHGRVEIHWRSFASSDSLTDVIAFYARREGTNAVRTSDSLDVHHGVGHLLTASSASNKELPNCSSKPKSTEKTLIVVSDKIQ